MHVVCTHFEPSARTGWLTIRKTRGPVDLVAYLTVEYGCREDAEGRGFCVINPPAWTFWLGGHHKYSLGGAIWTFGQWAFGRAHEIPATYRHTVSPEDLVSGFGWDPSHLVDRWGRSDLF